MDFERVLRDLDFTEREVRYALIRPRWGHWVPRATMDLDFLVARDALPVVDHGAPTIPPALP